MALGSPAQAGSTMLVLTICGFRKPTITEEYFHHHLSEKHAPLVRDALARHGITQYSMTHFTAATKPLIHQMLETQNIHDAAYDMITEIRFPDIQCYVKFRNDPFFKEKVESDHDLFLDAERVYMSVGWVEDHIVNGKVL